MVRLTSACVACLFFVDWLTECKFVHHLWVGDVQTVFQRSLTFIACPLFFVFVYESDKDKNVWALLLVVVNDKPGLHSIKLPPSRVCVHHLSRLKSSSHPSSKRIADPTNLILLKKRSTLYGDAEVNAILSQQNFMLNFHMPAKTWPLLIINGVTETCTVRSFNARPVTTLMKSIWLVWRFSKSRSSYVTQLTNILQLDLVPEYCTGSKN